MSVEYYSMSSSRTSTSFPVDSDSSFFALSASPREVNGLGRTLSPLESTRMYFLVASGIGKLYIDV